MIAFKIVEAIANCFYVFLLMIFVRCLLTWIPGVNWNNPILNALRSAVDLYLDLFRKIIPPVGMFDLSPIVASFVLVFLRTGVIYAAVFIMAQMGMLGN
ncbi:YggT family protein [bacterium]|nr:YggT family protein [bacterium]